MQGKSILRIIYVALLCLVANITKAQSSLIHYWHFNNYALGAQYTDTIHGVAADYSAIDTSKAKILYAEAPGTSATYSTHLDTVWTLATDFDTINLRMGDTAGAALRVRNPSDSMQLLFYIPTNGFKNILVTYASQSSSVTHGQLHQIFDYSVDSGATWRTSGLSMASDSAWLVYHRTSLTFTTDADVNNNPRLVLRITFSHNTTGTSGNNRFDNVTVDGDPIPTETKQIAGPVQINLYPDPVENVLHIGAAAGTITPLYIADFQGRVIRSFPANATINEVDTHDLNSGTYMFLYQDVSNGQIISVPFSKQ
jgi:hypothetical protein